jgi:hypothetical protein
LAWILLLLCFMKSVLFLIVAYYSMSAHAQQSTAQLFASGELLGGHQLYEIGYADTRKEIFTTGKIRNDEYRFMMDSGAPVFISDAMQRKYHFPYIVESNVKDASGKKNNIDIVMIDSISFGPFVFKNKPALVFDLAGSPLDCDSIAGNLGSNILQHLIVRFDVSRGKISFSNDRKLLADTGGPYLHMKISEQRDTYFPILLNDAMADTVHFDTGDGYLYHISKDGARALAAQCKSCVVREGFGVVSVGQFGLAEGFDQKVFRFRELTIGYSHISSGLAYITGDNKSRMGRELLNYGILELDYPAGRYAFIKYANPKPTPYYDYGFFPVADRQKVLIGIVWKGSEAEHNGVKAGDELVQVNNSVISALPACNIDRVIADAFVGDKVRIKVKRDSKTRSYTLNRKTL